MRCFNCDSKLKDPIILFSKIKEIPLGLDRKSDEKVFIYKIVILINRYLRTFI